VYLDDGSQRSYVLDSFAREERLPVKEQRTLSTGSVASKYYRHTTRDPMLETSSSWIPPAQT
jgi:hypothetical protein